MPLRKAPTHRINAGSLKGRSVANYRRPAVGIATDLDRHAIFNTLGQLHSTPSRIQYGN